MPSVIVVEMACGGVGFKERRKMRGSDQYNNGFNDEYYNVKYERKKRLCGMVAEQTKRENNGKKNLAYMHINSLACMYSFHAYVLICCYFCLLRRR